MSCAIFNDESIILYSLSLSAKLISNVINEPVSSESEVCFTENNDQCLTLTDRFTSEPLTDRDKLTLSNLEVFERVSEDIVAPNSNEEQQEFVAFGESYDGSITIANKFRTNGMIAGHVSVDTTILEGVERVNVEEELPARDAWTESADNIFKYTDNDGYLYKKSSNMFIGWESRYVVLSGHRLYYARSQQSFIMKRKVSVINFQTYQCQVDRLDSEIFSIAILDTNTKIYFRTPSVRVTKDWVNRLRCVINYVNAQQEDMSAAKPAGTKPWMHESVSENEFLRMAQTGDILLFQSKLLKSKVQRSLTFSDYDHVAFVVIIDGKVHLFDAAAGRDVSVLDWGDFKSQSSHYSMIVYRKLNLQENIQNYEDKIGRFFMETMGKQYSLSFGKLFTSFITPQRKTKLSKGKGYFCSELLAELYTYIGLLEPKKSTGLYWPGDFSAKKNIRFLKGASFSEEMLVILNQ